MLNRIVSLILIVCFLPLPNANSVIAWELTVLCPDRSTGAESGHERCDADDDRFPQVRHDPMTIDFDSIAYCELEKEVLEGKTRTGDDESSDSPIWCHVPPKVLQAEFSRFTAVRYDAGLCRSPFHSFDVLRC